MRKIFTAKDDAHYDDFYSLAKRILDFDELLETNPIFNTVISGYGSFFAYYANSTGCAIKLERDQIVVDGKNLEDITKTIGIINKSGLTMVEVKPLVLVEGIR